MEPLIGGTPRERFAAALDGCPLIGRVPHFELVFFLTMEVFGKVHPSHRSYHQWGQMSELERSLHRHDMAELFIQTAERFEHDAIFLHPNPGNEEEIVRMIDLVREKSGDRYFLMIHGDATFGIPDGEGMARFAYRLVDDPEGLKREASERVDRALAKAERLAKHGGLDGFALCSDYCFNTGPFLRPSQFAEFITPYLARLTQGYRDMGFYTIKHTDGNIMPILDQLISTHPHALHSLDPQGGVDIAEVKRICGDEITLIGNVNCGLMDTGTDEEVVASARYALENGMRPTQGGGPTKGGGGSRYIFSTSNCVYTGMQLSRYALIQDVWRREGNYTGVE